MNAVIPLAQTSAKENPSQHDINKQLLADIIDILPHDRLFSLLETARDHRTASVNDRVNLVEMLHGRQRQQTDQDR